MIDFELNRKSRQSLAYKLFFILGGLFFLFSGLFRIIIQDSFSFDTNFFINVLYSLIGLGWCLQGLNIFNLWSNSSVKIDDKKLKFYSSPFSKTISILWNEIEKIEIKVNKLSISLKEKENIEIELGWIPYSDLIEIKNEIENLAEKNGIACKRI